ncbi:MAG: hypothetical protein ACJ8R9_31695 [Steroidobacteraceae bacterium]
MHCRSDWRGVLGKCLQAPAQGTGGSRQTALSKSATIEMSDISSRSNASNLFDSGMSETSLDSEQVRRLLPRFVILRRVLLPDTNFTF